MKRLISMSLLAAMSSLVLSASAQSLFHRADSLTVQNNKWRIRTFFGLRLGKR